MRSNNTVKLIAIMAGLFLLLGFYPTNGAAKEKERYEEKFEKTVALARDGEVIVDNLSGSVEVKSWDKGEVQINALKVSRASTLSKAKENAGQVEIVVKKEGNTLRIKTERPEIRGRSLRVSVNYRLMIPAEASAKVNVTSGSVNLEEIGGAVKVNVMSGNVEVRKANKGVDCETTSGSITVQDIEGDAYLNTISGTITAERIRGSIKANVTSGQIKLNEVSEARVVEGKVLSGTVKYNGEVRSDGRYTLHAHSGNIEMAIPSDSGFELEARTFSGSINSDFEITISGKISRREISGKVNQGGAFVKLSTFSGNITLRKK